MNIQRWMSRQFFTFFMTWGIFLPYWTGWLINAKGMTVSQASLIMSLGLLARGLSTLLAFPYLSGKFSSKTLLNGMGIATLISILCYIPANSFTSLLVITLLFHFCYPALMPALDSAAGILVQHNQLKHYGKSRSWGSIGFVIAGLILTVFTGALGDQVILWMMLLGTMVLVYLSLLRAPDVLTVKPKVDKTNQGGMLKLFTIKHFALVLLVVILLQAAHASYYNYGYIYLQELHAPKYLIGVIINIAVIAEIIFFSRADKAFHKFSVGSLLALAALGSTIRWILLFAFPNVIVFCLAQTLHACSFAMGHYAFMKYLIKNIPHEQIPKAQGIYSALALSWSTAVFTIFGGYLYEIEPRYAFIGMIVCTVPAMMLALVYRKMNQKQQLQEMNTDLPS
ncbi:MFS transporter [Heyndrickxia oleronia]|uniref:MFS transporter n=1 Tax=Heyndrickxia oleronia TaxID=38875 RepID=UPI001C0EBCEC|nr:MFS transporter [Heyndrickxia oleronia]MBU5213147.1 MFS transporter [Heyndrickxia oleronia]MCI1590866.1 MFS transporter [Heyndrickxia oleronia]MCI1613977.1 MFS transporter [Heyndrickxia oleronia]MCI1745212.1 MFS transporter [Heyndrickxia oleronia]MCI1760950.1 MFS transporter [Heyndrickxia oleronia]